jgi:predicted TIM-barrel enzyme
MAKRYTRQQFLDRLRAEIERGKPLVMTGAGNGIAAKFIERGGVDILGVYNTGYFRMQGYGSLAGMPPWQTPMRWSTRWAGARCCRR